MATWREHDLTDAAEALSELGLVCCFLYRVLIRRGDVVGLRGCWRWRASDVLKVCEQRATEHAGEKLWSPPGEGFLAELRPGVVHAELW